jgi:flagellar protein FlaF
MSKNLPGSGNRPTANPYASAAGKYDQHAQAHTPDQRELEARVLLKAARAMQELQKNWDSMTHAQLDEVLTYNRQIWLMFVDTAVEDEDPARSSTLRNNIANLGLFVFRQTVTILSNPAREKLDILIEINRDIAAGLMTKTPNAGAGEQAAPPPQAQPVDTNG